jgi:hypothetical protein
VRTEPSSQIVVANFVANFFRPENPPTHDQRFDAVPERRKRLDWVVPIPPVEPSTGVDTVARRVILQRRCTRFSNLGN